MAKCFNCGSAVIVAPVICDKCRKGLLEQVEAAQSALEQIQRNILAGDNDTNAFCEITCAICGLMENLDGIKEGLHL